MCVWEGGGGVCGRLGWWWELQEGSRTLMKMKDLRKVRTRYHFRDGGAAVDEQMDAGGGWGEGAAGQ